MHIILFLLIGMAAGWLAGQLVKGRSNGLSGTQFRPETILEGSDDPCDRFSNFLGSQRALGVAEKHV